MECWCYLGSPFSVPREGWIFLIGELFWPLSVYLLVKRYIVPCPAYSVFRSFTALLHVSYTPPGLSAPYAPLCSPFLFLLCVPRVNDVLLNFI